MLVLGCLMKHHCIEQTVFCQIGMNRTMKQLAKMIEDKLTLSEGCYGLWCQKAKLDCCF